MVITVLKIARFGKYVNSRACHSLLLRRFVLRMVEASAKRD